MSDREERPVRAATSSFRTNWCQDIPRIRRWHFMWNASSDLLSATVRVQVSDAYNSTDWTRARQTRNLMERDSRLSFQTLSRTLLRKRARYVCVYLDDTDHQMIGNFPDTWSRTQGLRGSRWRVCVCRGCTFSFRSPAPAAELMYYVSSPNFPKCIAALTKRHIWTMTGKWLWKKLSFL